ncbi:hypothetical protein AVEN_186136-1 [Araneus ventricosus]|uniref:Uncharacterized protein n=1 Tax=Araneus ventricosus TaxID=182803 RepID=A0A4Y2DUU5_ARAVE|nr:hypothetical protein AVEN_186136-1 [Araneus ventricosus]
MNYFSAHHAVVARKSATGKIVLPEPAEFRCSCKRIPSYEADLKKSNVSMCPTQDNARVISRALPWPPRSPDITPCDFWLWGFLKDTIYRKRAASLPDLKDSIPRHVLDIPEYSLRSAVENMVLRLELITFIKNIKCLMCITEPSIDVFLY